MNKYGAECNLRRRLESDISKLRQEIYKDSDSSFTRLVTRRADLWSLIVKQVKLRKRTVSQYKKLVRVTSLLNKKFMKALRLSNQSLRKRQRRKCKEYDHPIPDNMTFFGRNYWYFDSAIPRGRLSWKISGCKEGTRACSYYNCVKGDVSSSAMSFWST